MSICIRNKPNNEGTISYKRHRYKNGICRACGASQKEQLRAPANRRTKRKADRIANKRAQKDPVIYA